MATVESIMQRELVSASDSESVATALDRLGSRDVGALVVLDGGCVRGILSERDIVRRVLACGRDPRSTRVGEVATRDPVTVDRGTAIKDCVRIVQSRGFRHLPIVDEELHPVGIISSRDLLQFALEGLERYIDLRRSEAPPEKWVDPYELLGSGF